MNENPTSTTYQDSTGNYEIINVDPRDKTSFITSDGVINVIHEMTMGDIIIAMCILSLLIWQVISYVTRGRI